jgi:hypothetical protein
MWELVYNLLVDDNGGHLMRQAPGTFTVWYKPAEGGTADHDRYLHGITAHSPANLMAQAKAGRPAGLVVKAIIWQHGGSQHIWFKVNGRSEDDCWVSERCEEAFGS